MKKKLSIILAGVVALSVVTACSDSGSGTTASTTAATTTAATTAAAGETAATTPATEAAQKVTLTSVTTYGGTDGARPMYLADIEEWQSLTGNTVDDQSATADEAFKARVIGDFSTGNDPDVLFFFNGVDANPFIESGKVVPISEIQAAYPEYASNFNMTSVPASLVDGVQYALPINGYWEGLFANKKVLSDAGVAVPDATTTWDTFLADGTKIKDSGATPIAAAIGHIPHYLFEYTVFNQQGPSKHLNVPKTASDDAGKAWVAAFGDIKALYEAGLFPSNTLSAKDDETQLLFKEGSAAYQVDGSWYRNGLKELENTADFTVTYFPGKGPRKATDVIGGLSSGWYISRKAWDDSAKQIAAVSFVEHMTRDDNVQEIAGVGSSVAIKAGPLAPDASSHPIETDVKKLLDGATSVIGAVEDLVTGAQRENIFTVLVPQYAAGTLDATTGLDAALAITE